MIGIDKFILPVSAPKPMSIETPSQNGGFMDVLASGCAGIEALFNAVFEAASEFRRLST